MAHCRVLLKIMQWIGSDNSGYAMVRVGVLWIFCFGREVSDVKSDGFKFKRNFSK